MKHETFGQMVRAARRRLDLSQQHLGETLGCGQTAVSGWENNHARPTTAVVVRLAQVLGLDLQELTTAAARPVEAPRERPAKKGEAPRERPAKQDAAQPNEPTPVAV